MCINYVVIIVYTVNISELFKVFRVIHHTVIPPLLSGIDNYTGFFGKGDGYAYVQLSADLSKMEYPQNYDVTFHTIYQKGNSYFSDVTNGVHIPPLKSVISLHLSPNPIELRPGDEKNLEVKIKSDTNLNSHAVIYARQFIL